MPTLDQLITPMRHESDPVRFVGRLRDAANAVHDRVMPLSALALSEVPGGPWSLTGAEPMLLPSGVADSLDMTLTRTALRHVADQLDIPLTYLDRLLAQHHDLAAENVNVLARRSTGSRLFRLWLADDGAMLRAIRSTGYRIADDFTALQAITAGLGSAGVELADCEVEVDLTPDRFRMRIAVPAINVWAEDVLGDYRPPFAMTGDTHAPNTGGDKAPIVWAGLEVANSETGGGAFTVTPRAVVLICRNGATRAVDAVRQIHVGQRLDEGVVTWTDETRRLQAELLTSQVRDAVARFCSVEYLAETVDQWRAAKGIPVTSATKAIERVVERAQLTEAEADNVLNCFMRSGDMTVLGVAQAVTAAAQLVESSDRQSELEQAFWQIVGEDRHAVGAAH